MMDSGVALITLNAGLSSRKARPWHKPKSLIPELLQTLRQSVFPILLGFSRIVLLSKLDYQEHPSEYGIHWNFYTTIAIVNILLCFVRYPEGCLPLGFALMIAYETLIVTFELDKYIFYAPRSDFVSANREGICSLVGYLSLQLIGVGLGNFIYK
jgi:phosphatidylinositol glycan class W